MLIGITEMTNLSEDEQIRLIGHRVIQHKDIVSFMVKDTVIADRYIQKLTDNFGTIRVIDRSQFTDGVMVRVGPPLGTMH